MECFQIEESKRYGSYVLLQGSDMWREIFPVNLQNIDDLLYFIIKLPILCDAKKADYCWMNNAKEQRYKTSPTVLIFFSKDTRTNVPTVSATNGNSLPYVMPYVALCFFSGMISKFSTTVSLPYFTPSNLTTIVRILSWEELVEYMVVPLSWLLERNSRLL